jgi:glycosyltransferase involved in cell wall biosynthesis
METQTAPIKPARVALLTHGLDTGGGVPTVARWLYKSLSRTNMYNVEILDLATSHNDAWSRRVFKSGTWFRRSLSGACDLREPHRHWGANAVEFEFMRYMPRTELTRSLQAFDLIQIVSGTPSWATVARNVNVPVVLQTATTARWERQAEMSAKEGMIGLWRRRMTRLTVAAERAGLTRADIVLVENQRMLQHLQNMGHRSARLAPPGVEVDRFQPCRSGWRPAGYLLSVCRLGDHRKGLDRMVRAYSVLANNMAEAPKLVLAGKGRLSESVVGLIRELGLENEVEIRSEVPAEELPALYRGASTFLQTSYEEGLGLSVLEAMASGLPVVSTDTAGSQETVVHGHTGYLVPADMNVDIAAILAKRVTDVLSGTGETLGANGRQRCVSMFSSDVALSRFTSAYSYLLGRTGNRRRRRYGKINAS